MESTSTPGSSSGVFTDPLEEISKLGKSRSARANASSVSDGVFDDLDPLNGFGRPVHPFSPGRDNGGKDGSPSRSGTPVSSSVREQIGKSSYRYSESNVEKKVPVDNFQEPPLFDVVDDSSYSHKSFGQTAPPPYHETSSQVDVSQLTEEQGQQSDDVWLSVLEIPRFTQPTSAPPPSRPPQPIPRRTSKAETGSFSSNSRKKGDEFSSPRKDGDCRNCRNPKGFSASFWQIWGRGPAVQF
ncbi:auxilin-related protein 2 [Forsythia ovata]|uniref:Auxilin-related protein 2 n=1 Tax=Forsythia ovata TaxID=205694 RepID=A0ABD1S6A7_9LAMI